MILWHLLLGKELVYQAHYSEISERTSCLKGLFVITKMMPKSYFRYYHRIVVLKLKPETIKKVR